MTVADSTRRRTLQLLSIGYLAQGIAPGFTFFAIPVLLRRDGVSLEAIGLSGLLLVPHTFSFVLGPSLDRLARRRGDDGASILAPLHAALIGVMTAIAFVDRRAQLPIFLALVVALNLTASFLGVATNGFAARTLSRSERSLGSGGQLGGYYAGSIVAGGLFLATEPQLGWRLSILALAAIMAVGVVSSALLARAHRANSARLSEAARLRDADGPARISLGAFLRRPEVPWLVAIIACVDFAENVGVSMVGPFLIDAGLSQRTTGLVAGTFGLAMALSAAIVASFALSRMAGHGLRHERALLLLSAAQSVALIPFAILAARGIRTPLHAAGAVGALYFAAGCFNVALYAWMMGWTPPRQASTDYALLACVHGLTDVFAAPVGGWLAGRVGFTTHFAIAAAGGLATLALAALLLRRVGHPPARWHDQTPVVASVHSTWTSSAP